MMQIHNNNQSLTDKKILIVVKNQKYICYNNSKDESNNIFT